MKKFVTVLLMVFLALGSFVTPASAKGEPLLEANVQPSVYQGRTEVLWFRATSQATKGSERVDWRIVLPKAVFPNRPEVVSGNPLMILDLGSEWGYVWKASLKPGKNSIVELRVQYSSTAVGVFKSAEVRGPGRKLVVLATFQTEILEAKLQSWFSAQYDRDNSTYFVLDTLGNKDVTVDLQISNPAGPQGYDLNIVFDYACVTDFAVSGDPGTVYEEDVPGDGFYYSSWAGTLGQDEVANWHFLMKSSTYDCSGQLFRLIDKVTGEVLLDVSILVDGKTPELIWSVTAPKLVMGGNTVDVVMTAYNPTKSPLEFNIDTEVWYTCMEINPSVASPTGANLAWFRSDRWSTTWTWSGTVNPGESLIWDFQIKSKPYPLLQCGVFLTRDHLKSDLQSIVYMDVLR